jgi:hypothetical protein
MAATAWPDNHPNTKFQKFIESSRQVIARVPRSSLVVTTSAMLEHIEALIDRQETATTRVEIELLVAQIGPLVNDALARMNVITTQLEQMRRMAS